MTATQPWTAPRVEAGGEVEALAAEWIVPYGQAEHLVRARDWLVHLAPTATAEMRVAALTHDVERMFPGGPVLRHADQRWDDPVYLYAHSLRSAEAVTVWLGGLGAVAATVDPAEIRRLVGLHEVGGIDGADEVQAADSLSFLETLAGLTRDWVRSGVCSRLQAERKLRYMADRVRVPTAAQYAPPLLEWAIDQLPAEVAHR
ncbi:hypothetical protein [Pseudonocardia oroxyli]|uniref:DUF4202 domain-containing protein n=1 Tax=Pseudonocardia oroxyli TaxID=366584 RepID=A0A1G8CU75_PSEOR|nr:hypothetical protein [Pseudonocardia oroxyli]SDH49062.1 hypothetical protein SAMN05216377_12357 [Pseudonocardia oroxyli]